MHLVDELPDAAVIERATFELDREPVDLHALLKDIILTQIPAVARKDIRIVLEEPDRPVMATVDRFRMAQVFDTCFRIRPSTPRSAPA